jgi:hypothetical protein
MFARILRFRTIKPYVGCLSNDEIDELPAL